MKIVRLHSLDSLPTALPELCLHADSSLLLPGHPLFLPEEEGEWVGRLHIAVRISRLGKSIRAKFASRYYDALTEALHITTADAATTPPALRALRDMADASIVLGRWRELPATAEGISMSDEELELTLGRIIETLSRRTTIKTGDILLLPTDVCYALAPGWLTAGEGLSVKIV